MAADEDVSFTVQHPDTHLPESLWEPSAQGAGAQCEVLGTHLIVRLSTERSPPGWSREVGVRALCFMLLCTPRVNVPFPLGKCFPCEAPRQSPSQESLSSGTSCPGDKCQDFPPLQASMVSSAAMFARLLSATSRTLCNVTTPAGIKAIDLSGTTIVGDFFFFPVN